MEELMTVREVAKVLNLTEKRVRELLRENTISGLKLPGGAWRIKPSVIENLLIGTK